MKLLFFMNHIPFSKGNLNWLFIILVLVFHISCSNTPSNSALKRIEIENRDSTMQKPPGSFSDSININYPAAVFYSPDSLQLEKIRAINDSMIFESAMHESFYQMRNSKIVLKRYYPKLKIVDAKNVRFLVFKKKAGNSEYIDLNAKNDAFGMFVFDGYKSPRLVDMTNLESELGFYFAK